MAQPSVTYQSYLLRLWHEGGASTPWRAMLESVTEPGERHHFPDLERLFAFLVAACARPMGEVECVVSTNGIPMSK